jgi:hypothetical protein
LQDEFLRISISHGNENKQRQVVPSVKRNVFNQQFLNLQKQKGQTAKIILPCCFEQMIS